MIIKRLEKECNFKILPYCIPALLKDPLERPRWVIVDTGYLNLEHYGQSQIKSFHSLV